MKKEKARLQQLRAMSHEEYLTTTEWQKTRKLALRRADGCCQECDTESVELEVYHLNGDNLGCEQESDVIVLCVECFNRINGSASPEVPNLSLKQRALICTPAAIVSLGLPALIHAPLPAEVGGLAAVIVLAIQCPKVYAAIKGGMPSWVVEFIDKRAEQLEQRRQSGEWSIMDRFLGRHMRDYDDDISEEDLEAYMRANGYDEEIIAACLGEESQDEQKTDGISPLLNEKSLSPRAMFEAPTRTRTVSEDAIHELEQLLGDVLDGFQIKARVLPEVTGVGPRVIQFGVEPTGVPDKQDGKIKCDDGGNVIYAKRTRVDEITKRAKDIQLALGAKSICILAPVPGQRYLGIEIPNPNPAYVTLTEVLKSAEYKRACASSKLVFALGRDITGKVQVCDIEKAPHILIGGATNAGKSVLLNVLIASLMTNATPNDIRLIMIDPKMVELTPYNGVAHLLEPVITDMTEVPALLKKAIAEMERRYRIFVGLGVRKLAEYRKKRESRPELENLPSWVIIIDEFADLMMTAPEETDNQVCRLAQKARAIGIHLVIATQRPSVDVITGTIKANIPTRIALTASSAVDSRVILDQSGAERLLGNGDMLYLPADAGRPERIQGACMTDAEAEEIVTYWQTGGQQYQPDENRTQETSSQKLDVDTLVSWYSSGRVNNEQFLTLMDRVSGRVTDALEDESEPNQHGRQLRVVRNASRVPEEDSSPEEPLAKDTIELGQGVTISREMFEVAIRMRRSQTSTGYRDLMSTFALSEHYAKKLNRLVEEAIAQKVVRDN